MKYSPFGIAVAFFLAVLPFVIMRQTLFYGAVNGKFFFSLLAIDLLLLCGAYMVLRGKETVIWKHRWLLYTLFGVLVTQYVSSYLGVFFERSLWSDILRSTGVLFLTHMAFFAALVGAFLKEQDWILVRRAVIFSAALFGVLTLIGFDGLGYMREISIFQFKETGLTFGNTTFAGVYLILAFIFGLIELARSWNDIYWRRLIIGALVATGISPTLLNVGILLGKTPIAEFFANPVLLLGSARASSATMLLLLVFLGGRYIVSLFLEGKLRKYALLSWSGFILVGIVLAVGLLFTPGSAVQDAYIKSSTAARILIWEGGLEAFKERPYFGWGPENFNTASERYFKNELYLDKNFGEIWFDRAHNIVVDTLVTVGAVGALAYMIFVGVFVWTVRRAYKNGLIKNTEAILLGALLPAHALQLQTGFDTVASYVLLSLIVGYVLSLERQMVSQSVSAFLWMQWVYKIGAVLVIIVALMSLKFVVYDEYVRQTALMKTFSAPIQEQRELIRISLAQVSDWESLRLSASSFIRGSIEGAAAVSDRKTYIANVVESAKIYEEVYQEYLAAHPDHYRARMNYAYLMLIETALGNYRLNEAKDLVESSYELSPENPLTHVLNALVFLYGINFDKAREHIDAAIALNPEIDFPKQMKDYIEVQIKRFPRNSLLQLENL